MAYRIFTDATADFPGELPANVTVIPMAVNVGGQDFLYGPGGNLSTDQFYSYLRNGLFASTSQINPETYREYFEPILQSGEDVLYLCFSSGMSGCCQSAIICMQELRQEYPQRKIECVDTLCASVGESFLVIEAEKKAAKGIKMEKLIHWINLKKQNVCHWFTVDTFDHLKHGGRVSAASAVVGTMLGIKPLLHVDENGKLAAVEKPRGRKKAMEAQICRMKQGWIAPQSPLVIIGHGDCPDAAEELKQQVQSQFPEADIRIATIGPVIGAHTGPGMLALIYWGNNR